MVIKRRGYKGIGSVVIAFVLVTSLFLTPGFAQDGGTTDFPVSGEGFVFSSEIAGITPDSFWYFLDFTGTTEEYAHEAGLMVQEGNIEAAGIALEKFEEAVREETTSLEAISLDGVTLEAIGSDSHEGMQAVETAQLNVLDNEIYAGAIEEILTAQVESGAISETEAEAIVDDVNAQVNELGAALEERTYELVHEVADNSDVSTGEVEIVYEDSFRAEYGDRFEEIASIDNVLELEDKIAELRAEAEVLRESGDLEGAAAVDNLLTLAESHGEHCINSEEGNFETQGLNHLNSAENIVDNVERYLDGEYGAIGEDESYKLMPVWPPYGEEDIKEIIETDNGDAGKFIEDYEKLKEEYADDAERLAWIEQEKERSEKVQELSEKLSDEGVLVKWSEELREEGLSEAEVAAKVHERFVEEHNAIEGRYLPLGLYVLPGDDGREETDGGSNPEVIDIGRIERIERINPETGEVTIEYVGWHNGGYVEDVQEGGGFALGIPYTYDGNTYIYGDIGYTVTTEAGVTHTFDYPEGYTPSPEYTYNYGDEAFTFMTESGDEIVYSAVGYEVKDIEDTAIAEEAYTQEVVTFIDGSGIDNEATGYVFNDDDGEAIVYAFNPPYSTYIDIANGKVYVPPTVASHIESTVYDAATNTYNYNYNGVVWSSSGDGTWTSPTGQQVNVPNMPAPVGHEDIGAYTTRSGEVWVYDPATNKWTETTTNSEYVVAPNNQYRYDNERGRYVDTGGNWYYSSGTGEGSYQSPWTYNTGTGAWVSSETGDSYDSRTGNIVRADGTVVGAENRPAGQGSEGVCYGCYYQGGEGTSGQGYAYTYDGGHYTSTPGGGYSYYTSTGEYRGPTTTTDSQGHTWTRDADGSWTSPTAGQYGSYDSATGTYAGGYYTGGGGYDSSGNYVGGEYGGYDSSGTYTGGATWTQGSDGTWSTGTTTGGSTTTGGTWTGGTTSGTTTGGTTTGGTTTGGTTTGGTTTGGTTTTGGDSGGSTTTGGSTTGGSTSGGYSGGGTVGGGVIAGEDAEFNNWFVRFWKGVFGI